MRLENLDPESDINDTQPEINEGEGNIYEAPASQALNPDALQAIQGMEAPTADAPDEAYDWVDRGIVDVPVAQLPDAPDIQRPEDFKKISFEDAIEGVDRLPQIQQEMQAGKTLDDFRQEDLDNGIQGNGGKAGYYQLFYGSSPIRVDKVGEDYTVIDGRHRIAAARLRGLETLPAHVVERVDRE